VLALGLKVTLRTVVRVRGRVRDE